MADPFNPTVPGLSYSQFPPEMQQEAASAQRRRAIADLMLQRMFQQPAQPTGYGGIPVPMSPFAGLNQLASGVVGGMAQSKADKSQVDLSTRYASGLADATNQVNERIAAGDMKGASAIAARWPAMRTISEKLLERQLPQNVLHTTYGPGGAEQVSAVNLNNPSAPSIPIGGAKTPPLHPVEGVDASGQPQTQFVNLQDPNLQPVAKPVKLDPLNLGGDTRLVNPYAPASFHHTLDPNRIPQPEDIEANAKMIAEYRMPGYTGFAARSPGASLVMRRVSELNPQYDASIFPVAKAGETSFLQKNGPQINAFNTLIGHIQSAKEMFAALENPTDIPRINAVRAQFLREFGSPLPTQLDVAKQFIADESVKAVLNGPGALDDRKAMAEKLKAASSPAQFDADANTVIKFGVEKLKAHEQQYKSATKSNRADFQERFLTPEAKGAYNLYGGGRRASDQGIGLPDPGAIDAELRRRAATGG